MRSLSTVEILYQRYRSSPELVSTMIAFSDSGKRIIPVIAPAIDPAWFEVLMDEPILPVSGIFALRFSKLLLKRSSEPGRGPLTHPT